MKSYIPSTYWSLVTGIGLIGWISAIICLTRWGFLPDGKLSGRRGVFWIIVSAIIFGIWIAGIRNL